MIRKIQYIFILLCLPVSLLAQEKFNIRGVLPWHNFLSGPTGWNLEDYRDYLDECQQYGINFIGFHNFMLFRILISFDNLIFPFNKLVLDCLPQSVQ